MDKSELDTLAWLAKEDASAFGECHGSALDKLVLRGFVEIHGTGGRARVSVTKAGLDALTKGSA